MGAKALLTLFKLRMQYFKFLSRQTLSAKIQSQKGNSPD